jgi:hypothetical protein
MAERDVLPGTYHIPTRNARGAWAGEGEEVEVSVYICLAPYVFCEGCPHLQPHPRSTGPPPAGWARNARRRAPRHLRCRACVGDRGDFLGDQRPAPRCNLEVIRVAARKILVIAIN